VDSGLRPIRKALKLLLPNKEPVITVAAILVLTENDVEALIDPKTVIDAVEEAFREYAVGSARMPAKMYLDLPDYGGDFRAMPAYISGYAGIKWVNVHPGNVAKGLRSVMATIVLNDPATGEPLAYMDGTAITNYRTGAAAAVASKYLARNESRSLGLVGLGEQAKTQLICISQVFNLEEVRLYDIDPGALDRFVAEFPNHRTVKCTVKEAVAADIVSTTTPVREPIVKEEWIHEGTHINAMGADAAGKEELDPRLLVKDGVKVIVDDIGQALHSGEVNVPVREGWFTKDRIYGTLSDVIAEKLNGREGSEITIFDSTGLAIQDISTAKALYERALEEGIGRRL
jgi:alanine dehydrogenase